MINFKDILGASFIPTFFLVGVLSLGICSIRYHQTQQMSATTAATHLQQRHRDQERELSKTQSFLAQQKDTQHKHDFELRTQRLIEQREVVDITRKLLLKGEEELERRKQEMAELHEGEMNDWKKTVESSKVVSQEQKMEMIRDRAFELKAQRENERQAFVGDCLEKQWADGCDELRQIQSKTTFDRLMKDQAEIIKKNKKVSFEPEPHFATSLINKDETSDNEKRRQASLELKLALDHQVQWKKAQAEEMTRKRQKEEKDSLKLLAMTEEKTKQTAKEALEKAKKSGEETVKDLQRRAMERDKREAIEFEQNRILLQNVLDMEESKLHAEKEKKYVDRNANVKFDSWKGEETKRDRIIDDTTTATRLKNENAMSKLHDDKVAAEAERKRIWLQEIDASRQEQIHRKQIEANLIRKEKERDAAEIMATLRHAEEADKRNAEKALALRIETMQENKRCMGQRAKENELKQMERHFVLDQIKNDDKVHLARLDEQMKRMLPPQRFAHTN
jgi:hypothetical protein